VNVSPRTAPCPRDFLSAWEEYRVWVDEYRKLDDVRVLVLVRFSARGKSSGSELKQMRTQSATLFHVRDGKVVRLVVYWQRERALIDLMREGYEGWARGS